jgi:hypothetical protein
MRKPVVLTTAAMFAAAAAVCPGTAFARDKTRVQHNDIPVTKLSDKASPKLLRATAPRDAASGQATGKR